MYRVMKTVKTDKVITATNEYLKQRSFEVNPDIKNEEPLSQEVEISLEEQVGLKELISPTCPNTFTFSTTSSHYNFIDQQYIRLKSWMTEASEPCRSELSQVLFPLFVHLFLELLTGAGKQAAKFFFSRHHQVFRVNRDYEQTLKQVWSAAGESTSSPIIQNLKTGKYIVRLSELTLNYFLKYLQTTNNPTLLQIFNNFLEVELNDMSGGQSLPSSQSLESVGDAESRKNRSNHLPSTNTEEEEEKEEEEEEEDHSPEEMSNLEETISAVRSNKSVIMPSVRVYSILNAYNGVTFATISKDSHLLACGFEDSVVKIWGLTPPLQLGVGGIVKDDSESPSSSSSSTLEFILFYDSIRGEVMERMEKKEEKDDEGGERKFCDRGRREEDEEEEEEEEGEETKTIGGRHTSGGELCVLRGHRGPVFDAAFTYGYSSSTYLYTVGEDASMRLWDLTKRKAVALYQGHHYPIWCLDISSHSMYVATGSYDETARLWTTECTYPLRAFLGHAGSVDCVAFHPNCSYLATGSHDKTIRLWQVNDASVARVLLQHNSPIKTLRFSPNGKYLASGSDTGEILIWDLAAGKVIHELGGSTNSERSSVGAEFISFQDGGEPVVSIDWSRDSKLLFSSTSDGNIKGTRLNLTEGSEANEVENIICSEGNYNGSSLIHTSLSDQNFLSTVVAVNGER